MRARAICWDSGWPGAKAVRYFGLRHHLSRDGGTGRRSGLKTRRLHWHTSSILVPGTIIINDLEQNPKTLARKTLKSADPCKSWGVDPFPGININHPSSIN